MKKIEDLELSYDEWVEGAIEGKEIEDDNNATEEESETGEVSAVKSNDEGNILV